MAEAPDGPPLAGLKVLDLSQGMAGPNCGMQFAAFGAEVIKIEPVDGDWVRNIGRRIGDHSAISLAVNHGKQSLAVDLKNPAGLDVVRRLAGRSDVLIENNRPGVTDRLGLGYDRLAADNPRLIYLSMSGYGPSGPSAQDVATDTVAQAYSGMMSHTRDPSGRPMKIGFLLIDAAASLFAFQAATVALFRRERTGRGRHIDVSLLEASAALQSHKIVEHTLEGTDARALNVPAGNYRTADGWIALSLMRERHFVDMCAVVGLPDLASDGRFSGFDNRARHAEPLMRQLAERLLTRTTGEWLEAFKSADVLASRINTVGDWLEEPQVAAIGATETVRRPELPPYVLPRVPGTDRDGAGLPPAPGIGADTRAVLRQAGLSQDDIDGLLRSGAVAASRERDPGP